MTPTIMAPAPFTQPAEGVIADQPADHAVDGTEERGLLLLG